MSNGITLAHVESLIREAVKHSGPGQPGDPGETELAIKRALEAAGEALQAAGKAKEAYQTTRLVYQSPVADFEELSMQYPSPEIGWTVQTYKDGKRYRFDGQTWVEIDVFGQNLQVVNSDMDGLMSTAEHLKLNEIPLEVKDRVIVFCKESRVYPEVLGILAPFPFDGEILHVKGYCGVSGDTATEIRIERSKDLIHWQDVMGSPLKFEAFQHQDDGEATFEVRKVEAGDIFRINIIEAGSNIQHLTIQLTIRT
ncbi:MULTISPECIES: hypothetical protein [Paenibacillus]|uniref:hypothetical protein n=1 Tax=Paenibacillus TaxID=44249 RepID=UPI00096EED0A|nr:hypothetical protein [Paenibacillus amylolyticus]OMF43080.1 hypothetical protein BK136_15165 [Paenibacillus amylolyticus]